MPKSQILLTYVCVYIHTHNLFKYLHKSMEHTNHVVLEPTSSHLTYWENLFWVHECLWTSAVSWLQAIPPQGDETDWTGTFTLLWYYLCFLILKTVLWWIAFVWSIPSETNNRKRKHFLRLLVVIRFLAPFQGLQSPVTSDHILDSPDISLPAELYWISLHCTRSCDHCWVLE